MYGCPYCKMDKEYNEYCALTKEPTKGDVQCDCEWEDCGEYREAQKPIKPAGQKSKPTNGAAQRSQASEPRTGASVPKLMQTSLFGAAGEKEFKG